jgi:hypothetical protein
VRLQAQDFTLNLAADGQRLALERDGAAESIPVPLPPEGLATITLDGRICPTNSVRQTGPDRVELAFRDSPCRVVLRVEQGPGCIVLHLDGVTGRVDKVTFFQVNSPLITALALSLETQVSTVPGGTGPTRVTAHAAPGLTAARVALLAAPTLEARRDGLARLIRDHRNTLPYNPVGGPWALESEASRGSYLIDEGGRLTLETVDKWIALAQALGVRQIDIHTGRGNLRFGDLEPAPERFPNGLTDLRLAIERLHRAGLGAGLHTYAFYVAKDSAWVTPVPHPDLATVRDFTLAEPLSETDDTVLVRESTAGLSAVTGFQVRNSATVRIGDELVEFSGVRTEAPYGFTGCRRGACGTRPVPHPVDSEVAQLRECFGLFLPRPGSELYDLVVQRTADVYNQCGFDMIYLDAIDGADAVDGAELAWYHAGRFVDDLLRRCERPPIMEMSMLTHHLWIARSRMGAVDVPLRGMRDFTDWHCSVNQGLNEILLPGNLGWAAVFDCTSVQVERTFPDDLEYLCSKALAYDNSLSWLLGFDPETFAELPGRQHLARVCGRYERLRLSRALPESVLHLLRAPGYTAPSDHDRRVVMVTAANPYDTPQAPGLRIEGLWAAGAYTAPEARLLTSWDPTTPVPLTALAGSDGVDLTWELEAERDPDHDWGHRLELTARNRDDTRRGACAGLAWTFPKPLDLNETPALGVWVRGDGSGAVLNLQLQCPVEAAGARLERYVTLDFTGWRYQSLVEVEGEELDTYQWPYSWLYRIWADQRRFAALNIWLNHLPANGVTNVALSPVKALPLLEPTVRDAVIEVGDTRVHLPFEVPCRAYAEILPNGDCTLYDWRGEPQERARVEPWPTLGNGAFDLRFRCTEGRPGLTLTWLGPTLWEGDAPE